ncbi:MAG: O-antigen ligase family protein [Bacteroidia bacterium]|nr:O-antigen ligase family protein [Bacteroidia bacterium]
MSLSQFFIGGYWLLEGNFKKKWLRFKERKSIHLIISIWLLHAIGLIWTEDFHYAINDLRIKLPFLLLPVFVGTSAPLPMRQVKTILKFFILAVFAGTAVSMAVLLGFTHHVVNDIRDISIYISHIRFSLLINVAIIIMIYFLLSGKYKATQREIYIYSVLIIWFIIFLFILKSFTGIAVFFIMSFVMLLYWAFKKFKIKWKILLVSLILSAIVFASYYFYSGIKDFYTINEIDLTKLDTKTKEGNAYSHYLYHKYIENGNYVYLYLCEDELRREWNKSSHINYDDMDARGQPVKYTLFRYLASKGLRKDAEAFRQLSNEDISRIESGIANAKYFGNNFAAKRYELIWQIDCYLKGGNPGGHSVTQRMEYLKAGIGIIKKNFWFGIGTGDLNIEFAKQYKKMNSPLQKEFRFRAHNQFVTFFLTFGIIGFLWIMFSMIAPVFIEKAYKSYIFLMFFIVALVSMLNEDTLESQPGVTFFLFFYILFILGIKKDEEGSSVIQKIPQTKFPL